MSNPQYPTPNTPAYNSAPPLEAPYYGASIKVAVERFFRKYATFTGRASRSEYWWWVLVSFVVTLILQIIIFAGSTTIATTSSTATSANAALVATGPGAVIGGILLVIWGLGTIIPSLALLARRLHDANMSAWLILLLLIPGLGGLALLIMAILPSNPQGQRFDQPPTMPAYPGTGYPQHP